MLLSLATFCATAAELSSCNRDHMASSGLRDFLSGVSHRWVADPFLACSMSVVGPYCLNSYL
jgi:hypothetical protein